MDNLDISYQHTHAYTIQYNDMGNQQNKHFFFVYFFSLNWFAVMCLYRCCGRFCQEFILISSLRPRVIFIHNLFMLKNNFMFVWLPIMRDIIYNVNVNTLSIIYFICSSVERLVKIGLIMWLVIRRNCGPLKHYFLMWIVEFQIVGAHDICSSYCY